MNVLLREPQHSIRSKFINRNDEINRIEAAIDDPEFRMIWLFGFTGVGKRAVVSEAGRRLFEGAETVGIDVADGTGLGELALTLNAARGETLAESLGTDALETEIRLSIETIAQAGWLLVISNVQHWFDEDGAPEGPLPLVMRILAGLAPLSSRPAFLTSTRRPTLDASVLERLMLMQVPGLRDNHVSALLRNWHFAIYGRELEPDDANRIAPKLFGHPMAARLAAGLLGDHTAEFLDQYPRELIALMRDLARVLLQSIKLAPEAEQLMETLALADAPLSPS